MKLLGELSLPLHSLDGVLIDTGPSELHLADTERTGLDLTKNGLLDLRLDPDSGDDGDRVRGLDVLRLATDLVLLRMLRTYGGMVRRVRPVVSAIVEGRYMFKEYRTVEELYSVVRTSATNTCERTGEDEHLLSIRLLSDVHRGLRSFVNDELNEFHFALSVIAENFLKPRTGVLVAITRSNEEEKVIFYLLT